MTQYPACPVRPACLLALAGAAVLGLALVACGTSSPKTSAGSTAGSAVAVPPTTTPAPTPTTPPTTTTPSHATAPSPGAGRGYQNYLDCLDDPDTTLAYCQQFNPNPSPSPTPTPAQTIPTAPFVVGDCVVVSNAGTEHSLSGAYCTNSHAYRVINVTVGSSNKNYCRSVDPTFATDDVLQFTSNQANRTYCLNPTPGSTGHQ